MKKTRSCGRQACLPAGELQSTREMNAANAGVRSLRERMSGFFRRGQEGSQLVEFALVAPLLLVIFTGMSSFAMALYSYQQLGYAVSSAAQQVGAQQGLINDPCAAVQTDINGALPSWTASKFSYSAVITYINSSGSAASSSYSAPAGSSFSCTAAGASGSKEMAINEPMTITVNYAYTWFPIMTWTQWGSNFTPSGNISVSESVLVE